MLSETKRISVGLVNTNFGELKSNWNPRGKTNKLICYQNKTKIKKAKFKFSNTHHYSPHVRLLRLKYLRPYGHDLIETPEVLQAA